MFVCGRRPSRCMRSCSITVCISHAVEGTRTGVCDGLVMVGLGGVTGHRGLARPIPSFTAFGSRLSRRHKGGLPTSALRREVVQESIQRA